MIKKIKIIVGMSGGVDSSVSVYLLQKQGYNVEGLFMKNWDEDDNTHECNAKKDFEDAQSIANDLGVKLHFINFAAEYWKDVFKPTLEMYNKGKTPNPDVFCNKFIKFNLFWQYAKQLGADFMATGHYAKHDLNNPGSLFMAEDKNKDQTYFLYAIKRKVLEKTIFPLANLTKTQVRKIAKSLNLISANKKDSTGICFIGKKNMAKFLAQYLKVKPGNFLTKDGIKIGTHQGACLYTLGQRKGLGIGGIKNSSNNPWYVFDKDIANNIVYVTQQKNNSSLQNKLKCNELNWINNYYSGIYQARLKHRGELINCKTFFSNSSNNILEVELSKKTLAVPGQSIVFYKNNECLGGGTII